MNYIDDSVKVRRFLDVECRKAGCVWNDICVYIYTARAQDHLKCVRVIFSLHSASETVG